MVWRGRCACWVGLGLLLSGCREAKLRRINPADMAQVRFATTLFQAAASSPEHNEVIAPAGLWLGLAALQQGAYGRTAADLGRVVGLDRLGGIQPVFMSEWRNSTFGAPSPKSSVGHCAVLTVAPGCRLADTWQAAARFIADARLLPGDVASEPTRRAVRELLSQTTQGRITDLDFDALAGPEPGFCLFDVVAFNGKWDQPFDPSQTRNGPFHCLDGRTVNVPLMHQTCDDAYATQEDDGTQVVSLPYRDCQLNMLAVSPPSGQYAAFERQLKPDRLASWLTLAEVHQVHLTMPRFTVDRDWNLREALGAMGLAGLFEKPDLRGMDAAYQPGIKLCGVVQVDRLATNEEGTVAVAASGIGGVPGGPPPGPLTITLDRPFLFVIYQRQTHAVLFIGRVADPSAA